MVSLCYKMKRSILIERSPEAYCKKLPHEKKHALLKPLTIIRLIVNEYSPLFLSDTLWNVGQSAVFSSSSPPDPSHTH